jgi:hypothetical protein
MQTYPSRRLTYVWVALTVVTMASWLIGRGHGVAYQINAAVTVGVLVIAAVKALLVFHSFMEVGAAPAWLKRTAYGWVFGLLSLLLVAYWAGH